MSNPNKDITNSEDKTRDDDKMIRLKDFHIFDDIIAL
jgi:hypothetical protein